MSGPSPFVRFSATNDSKWKDTCKSLEEVIHILNSMNDDSSVRFVDAIKTISVAKEHLNILYDMLKMPGPHRP